jgi:hypothetical protein
VPESFFCGVFDLSRGTDRSTDTDALTIERQIEKRSSQNGTHRGGRWISAAMRCGVRQVIRVNL